MKTTLYDFLKITQKDFDTYDTEYDAEVTVCYIADEDASDEYDKFCINIIKLVNVVRQNGEYSLIVDWCELIRRNMDMFKSFAEEHWINSYEDDEDEFIYQWIKEINLYLAGYVNESFYGKLNKFLEELK